MGRGTGDEGRLLMRRGERSPLFGEIVKGHRLWIEQFELLHDKEGRLFFLPFGEAHALEHAGRGRMMTPHIVGVNEVGVYTWVKDAGYAFETD